MELVGTRRAAPPARPDRARVKSRMMVNVAAFYRTAEAAPILETWVTELAPGAL